MMVDDNLNYSDYSNMAQCIIIIIIINSCTEKNHWTFHNAWGGYFNENTCCLTGIPASKHSDSNNL